MENKTFTFQINEELLSRGKEAADKDHRTFSALLRYLLIDYLIKQKEKEQTSKRQEHYEQSSN